MRNINDSAPLYLRFKKPLALAGILVLFALCLSVGAQDATPESQWNNPDQLKATNVEHKTFHSASMDLEVGYNIFLPGDYDPAKKYPVIYGLHGAGRTTNENSMQYDAGRFDQILKANGLPQAIIVLVNGKGASVGYNDWPDRKDLGETAVIKELIPHIDKEYSTIASREGRALIGFSMGGYGSVRLLSKYPDMFTAAVAFAGAFKWATDRNMEDVMPVIEKNAEQLAKNKPTIVLYQGQDDTVGTHSEAVHDLLKEKGVASLYVELPGVGHNYGKFLEQKAEEGVKYIGMAFQGKEPPAGKKMAGEEPESATVTSQPAEWCTVTMPSSVSVGDKVEMKVAWKNLPEGSYVSCNLGYSAASGQRGYMGGGTPASVKVTGDGEQVFKGTVVSKAPDMDGLLAAIFTSEDGTWATNKELVYSPPVPVVKKKAAGDAPGAAAETKVSQPADWCTVTMPAEVSVGDQITYKLAYKDVSPATFLTANLGWVGADGQRGYMGNGSPLKVEIEGSGEQTFTARVTDKGPNVTSIVAFIFLSPDGDYANRTTTVSSDPTPVVKKETTEVSAPRPSQPAVPAKAGEGEVLLKPAEWVQVIMPESCSVGDTITIKVITNGVDEKLFVSCNLGFEASDGNRGFLGGGSPGSQKVENGVEKVFTGKVVTKPNLSGVIAAVFLSTGGDWSTKTEVIYSEAVPVK